MAKDATANNIDVLFRKDFSMLQELQHIPKHVYGGSSYVLATSSDIHKFALLVHAKEEILDNINW